MSFSKVGVTGWKEKSPDLAAALRTVAEWAAKHTDVEFLAMETLKDLVQDPIRVVPDEKIMECDLLIAIGGDGTVLSTARLALGHHIPILGVNAGHVGFLAETRVADLAQTLDCVRAGEFSTRDRSMIDASIIHNGVEIDCETVLNEVHVRAKAPQRMVNVNVEYNGRPLTTYWADSLLLSTPTGSTAYNLAAGGPILYPSTRVFVITPVAPSSLSVRPLVIPAVSTCTIYSATAVPLDLVFDGRVTRVLEPGDSVKLFASENITTFIRMNHNGFVNALREKLGWTGKPRFATQH